MEMFSYDCSCLILCDSQLLEAIQLTYFRCDASASMEGEESCPRTAQGVKVRGISFPVPRAWEVRQRHIIANHS